MKTNTPPNASSGGTNNTPHGSSSGHVSPAGHVSPTLPSWATSRWAVSWFALLGAVAVWFSSNVGTTDQPPRANPVSPASDPDRPVTPSGGATPSPTPATLDLDAGDEDGDVTDEQVQGTPVVVSLTFDDGFASQSVFLDLVEELGVDVKATFFVNSSRLNLERNEREPRDHVRYAPLDVWLRAARAGHEIGAHSVSHVDLTCTPERHVLGTCRPGHSPLSDAERLRQICSDGYLLRSLGFQVRGFAYPFGRDRVDVDDESVHALVARCGFDYARTTYGLRRGLDGAGSGPLAEVIPPANPRAIRSYDSISRNVRFDDMRRWIEEAGTNGGGWVPFIFHHVSDSCAEPDEPVSELGVCVLRHELEALVRWLGRVDGFEAAPDHVRVRTMGEVMLGPEDSGGLQVANAGLEQRHSGSIDRPNCYDRFLGRHDVNFVWSSPELEQTHVYEGEFGDPSGADGRFEKLIPTASHRTPLMRMTTRDDQCYLPVSPGGHYDVQVRARSVSSDGNGVTGRFVFRVLRVVDEQVTAEPVWSDWDVGAPSMPIEANWGTLTFSMPELPMDAVALAFGFQYVAPTPVSGEQHELWIDDFAIRERPGRGWTTRP